MNIVFKAVDQKYVDKLNRSFWKAEYLEDFLGTFPHRIVTDTGFLVYYSKDPVDDLVNAHNVDVLLGVPVDQRDIVCKAV